MGVREATAWAIDHARNHGWSEHPPGSNETQCWVAYDEIYGTNYNGQPWCGASNAVVVHHGGWTAPGGIISVGFLWSWGTQTGRAHRITSAADVAGIREGDLLVIGSPTEHEEYALADGKDGQVYAHGGNTSPGAEGSQFNGGTEAIKYRAWQELYGYVTTYDLINDPTKDPKDVPVLKRQIEPQYKAESATGPLRLWMTGKRVEKLQDALGIESDGYYGRSTVKAVKAWKVKRRFADLQGDIASSDFIALVEKHRAPKLTHEHWTTLHTGDLGGLVRKLQRWLNAVLKIDLKVDGDFGKATETAVNKIHAKVGNAQHGIAGPRVWEYLDTHR